MKKGVLFLNGDPPDGELLEKIGARKRAEDLLVVCTDGAYAYVSPHFLPDTVVGDFDSLDRSVVAPACEVIPFPVEKDFTDGFLAVRIMAERGVTDLDIYGGYGGRPDMTESNYFLLALALKLGVRARLCGDMNAYMTNGLFSATLQKGVTVSVVPFTDTLHILYTKGLKYALSDYVMEKFRTLDAPDYIMGVSNESVAEQVKISVGGGVALIFVRE